MIKTLHTYVGQKAVCQRARRWLADRNVLTKTEELKRGHYRFTMHIPTHWDEAKARSWLATALTLRGDVHYEPPVYEEAEGEDRATKTARLRVASRQAHAEAASPTIHDHIREKCELAKTYAEDGAFHTAARIFMELSVGIKTHAEECDKLLKGDSDNGR